MEVQLAQANVLQSVEMGSKQELRNVTTKTSLIMTGVRLIVSSKPAINAYTTLS